MELTDNGIYKCRIYEWEGKVTIIKDGCEVTDQEVLEWWGLDKPTQKCAFNHVDENGQCSVRGEYPCQ